jgi:hypothetical protein
MRLAGQGTGKTNLMSCSVFARVAAKNAVPPGTAYGQGIGCIKSTFLRIDQERASRSLSGFFVGSLAGF